MALVPGICTQCGATLSADDTKDCMICPYCGTPFIVEKAINHFQNTYNISNSVVNFYGGESRDFVIRAGVLEKYNGSGAIVTIPDNVTVIGKGAFRDCIGLREVSIPEGVVDISYAAFWGCVSLKKVSMPGSLKSIASYAFRGCMSLQEVFLSDSITILGPGAFWDCRNLETIRMPNNMFGNENIGQKDVFSVCPKLVNVELPNETWRPILVGSRYYSEFIKTQNMRKQQTVCIHCGGSFKGILTKVCSKCGKTKDY